MSWLKKVGMILLRTTEIVTGLGPVVSALIPGKKDDAIIQVVSQDLAQIASIIAQVEVIGQALGLPGDKKLIAASAPVAQIILQSSVMVHHKIADPVLFQKGCASIASGMADVLNSLKDDVDTEDKKA